MEFIEINDQQLEKITEYTLENETHESTIHPFYENKKKKMFKLFKDPTSIENKTKKIILLNERLKDNKSVIKAECIIKHKGKIIGYTMPFIPGNQFNALTFRRKKNLEVLRKISKELKELHNHNIICGDLINNIIVTKNGDPYFVDYDNFAIDNLGLDVKNIFLQDYEEVVKIFDYHYDYYELNLYTLSILSRISPKYLESQYRHQTYKLSFFDDEINKIVKKTFKLSSFYREDLIIDKINSKKDLIKIKPRLF